jgi:hypothetical protein
MHVFFFIDIAYGEFECETGATRSSNIQEGDFIGSASTAGANLPLLVRRHRALMDTRLTALRKEKRVETAMQMQKEIEALSRMTVGQLRQKYLEVFGEESRSNHKQKATPANKSEEFVPTKQDCLA